MPLSKLTLLRGALIVAFFAFALFHTDAWRGWVVAAASLFVLPLLTWLLVSNAVKEAPPFDDTAFHRTRPVTAGRVFRHLAGFHLLVLAGMLGVILILGWFFNLGAREIAPGMLMVTVPWIALVALFATVASLSTVPERWNGWGAVTLLLLPAISFLLLSFSFGWTSIEWTIFGMPLAGAVIYPALWWLVAVKRRWFLGCGLGLTTGLVLPWVPIPLDLSVPGRLLYGDSRQRVPEPVIRRLKDPAAAAGMVEEQAELSRLLEVRGLGPDEFIGSVKMDSIRERPPGESHPLYDMEPAFQEMYLTAFSTNANGRLVPATTALFHVVNSGSAAGSGHPIPGDRIHNRSSALSESELLGLPVNGRRHRHGYESLPIETTELPWSFSGTTFRWVKVLEVPATKGGRAKLPDGGVIQLLPPDRNLADFVFTVRVMQGRHRPEPLGRGSLPALVARDADGRARLIQGHAMGRTTSFRFLIREREFEYRKPSAHPQPLAGSDALQTTRLEVYWPEYRGFFRATLPPP